MKYFEVTFRMDSPEALRQDACDVLSAMIGEVGFETFEETVEGLKGYVQKSLFNETELKDQLELFPFENVSIEYKIEEADDQDWNAQWESEGFEPIIVKKIIIHDGRHLPENSPNDAIQIEIDAHLAFGTGTHETTRMMISSLFDLNLENCLVLDCGCGTGILGIAAIKLGACQCTGYDIDEWSADNARHNAVINLIDSQYNTLLGDAFVLDQLSESFDVVMANINRNILLNDLPVFQSKTKPGGKLLLSGFYQQDETILIEKAQSLGYKLNKTLHEGDWSCLQFTLTKKTNRIDSKS